MKSFLLKAVFFLSIVTVVPISTALSATKKISVNIQAGHFKNKYKMLAVFGEYQFGTTNIGNVELGDSVEVTINMYHFGGGPEQPIVYPFATSLVGTEEFSIISDGCNGQTLTQGPGGAPGTPCHIVVRFTPLFSGSRKAIARIPLEMHYPDQPISPWTYLWDLLAEVVPKVYDPNPPVPNCSKKKQGSIINVDAQALGEVVPVAGAPFDMHYSSEFAQSYISLQNTVDRKSFFNPEGWTVSIQKYYDISQNRLFLGTGTSENRRHVVAQDGSINVVSSSGDEVYEFNAFGRHLRTLFSLTGTPKYTFTYSSSGKLISVTDAYSNVTTLNRNSSEMLTSIVASTGQVTNISTNGAGLISVISNPNSESYLLTYKSGTDLLESFTKPHGEVSTFVYDSDGRLTQDLGNGGNTWSFLQELLTTDRKVTQSSSLGRATTYYSWGEYGDNYRTEYSPEGLETEYGESENWSYQWTPMIEQGFSTTPDERFGNLLLRRDNSYVIINNQYSSTQLNKTVAYLPGASGFFYFSTITETENTSGRIFTKVYDRMSKIFTTTSAAGATTTAQINSQERPISSKIGNDTPWTFTYNTLGQLTQLTQGNNNTLTNAYNSSGYLLKTTNVRNEEVSYVYDLAGRVTQKTRPDGKIIAYSYDSNGNLVGITPPTRPEHIFGFNSMELLSTYQPPALSGLTTKDTLYSYNLDKQLTNILRPDGQSAAYSYGSTTGLLNQVGIARGNYAYVYQTNSALVAQTTSPDDIKSVYGYYGRNLSSEEQKRTSDDYLFGKVSFGYDSDHRLISRTVRGHSAASISTINTTYNADSKPIQIGDLYLAYSYPSGRLNTTTLNNISDARTYDSFGNLESYTATYTPTSGSAQILYSYTLTRDLGSRITGKSETVLGVTDTYAYTYDVVGRLKTITKNGTSYSNYNYDDNGNRTSGMSSGQTFTSTYDNQDRLLTLNSRVFTYNANGDVIHTQWHPTQQSSYAWDALGNMISAVSTSGSAVEFKYDGQNRWVQTIIDGQTTTRRIYENDYRIAAQYTDGGYSVKEFIYATNANSPDYMLVAGEKYRLIKDHLGSPRLVVKSTDGTVSQRLDYTDLGKVLTNTNTSMQPYGFAGGIMDNYTRFVKFGARFYDTEVGRWTSKDPILFGGGDTNLYGYTFNDPVNFIDPEGTDACVMNQGTGTVICTNDSGDIVGISNGYSGSGAGRNNPSMENVEKKGPTPRGTYTIGHPYNQPGGTGSFTRSLNPTRETRASFPSNRFPDTFRWHGDNGEGTASEGCPISTRATRGSVRDGSPFSVINWSF